MIAAWQIAGQTCVQVFFVRGGRNNGNRAFFPAHAKTEEAAEVLAAFVAPVLRRQAAAAADRAQPGMPEQALVAEALSLKAGRKVEIAVPQRGEKRAVVRARARPTRARRWNAASPSRPARRSCWRRPAKLFGLAGPPERIEVYDNSHIMGTNPYGVMIVSGPQGFTKDGVPQVRHPRPDHAGRRFRHDARGAGAPVRPRAQGAGGVEGAAPASPCTAAGPTSC